MLTVLFVLIGATFVTAIASAAGKVPLWVPIVILSIVALVQVLPLK